MNCQFWIQADSCFFRWLYIPSPPSIPPGTCFKDTNCFRIPYDYSHLSLEVSKSSEQGSNVVKVLLGRSMALIFLSFMVPALLQTSLELMLLVCFQTFLTINVVWPYHGCYYYSLQSTLPILVTLLFRTTLRVSSPMWTGSHGVRRLSIRFWPSWTLLQTLASHSTLTEQTRWIYWTTSHWDLLEPVFHSATFDGMTFWPLMLIQSSSSALVSLACLDFSRY